MKTKFLYLILCIILTHLSAEVPKPEEACSACLTEVKIDAPPATFTEESIYQVESKWVNQNNQKFALSGLKGRAQIITMGYTHCQYVCPRLIADMLQVKSAIMKRGISDVGFVFVSIDHERDKPEVLLQYSKKMNLDLVKWNLLHGDKDEILELAALLNVRFKKHANGDYSHSNIITVLNEEGEIIHQLVGLNQGLDELINSIEQIM